MESSGIEKKDQESGALEGVMGGGVVRAHLHVVRGITKERGEKAPHRNENGDGMGRVWGGATRTLAHEKGDHERK